MSLLTLRDIAPHVADFYSVYGQGINPEQLISEIQHQISPEKASTFHGSDGLVGSKLMSFNEMDLLFLYDYHPELDKYLLEDHLSEELLIPRLLIARERERQKNGNERKDLLSVMCNLGQLELLKMMSAFSESMYSQDIAVFSVINTQSILCAMHHLLVFAYRENEEQKAAAMFDLLIHLPQHRLLEDLSTVEQLFVTEPTLCDTQLHHTLLRFVNSLRPELAWDSSVLYMAEAAQNTRCVQAYEQYFVLDEVDQEPLTHSRLLSPSLYGEWGKVRVSLQQTQ